MLYAVNLLIWYKWRDDQHKVEIYCLKFSCVLIILIFWTVKGFFSFPILLHSASFGFWIMWKRTTMYILRSTGQSLLGVCKYGFCQNHRFCINLFFLVLMPCLHEFLSFLMIVQHENLGYWRSWIHWVSLSWQIDGKWKKWGQLVNVLLIMVYLWCSFMM